MLAALLLNRVTLAPGEAIYLPAGNLHAYLSGAGVEMMANSDNVLRGGLTPKHVDVPELLRVLDFDAEPPPVLTGRRRRRLGALRHARRGVPAAPVHRVRTGRGARRRPAHPAVHGGGGGRGGRTAPSSALARGDAVWLAASDARATVEPRTPSAQLFLAGDGLS